MRLHYAHRGDAAGRMQYGLVAEEVAGVYPELVDYGDDGRPPSVRYLLLNELQEQTRQCNNRKNCARPRNRAGSQVR